MQTFDADHIYVSLSGVIFINAETEKLEKFELPFIVYPSGEIKELQPFVLDLSDVANLLDCETVRFIHKAADKENPGVIGNILCVVSSTEINYEKLKPNTLAKLIAWRMGIQSFGDKVIGNALFVKPEKLAIDLT